MQTTKLTETKECAITLSRAIFNFINGRNYSPKALWLEMKKQNIGCQSDSVRIFQYFKDKHLIYKDVHYRWNGKTDEWINDIDKRNNLVYEMLQFGDIIKTRGRVKGKKYPRKHTNPESEPVPEVSIKSLIDYSDKDLVEELRRRGWTIKATKEL